MSITDKHITDNLLNAHKKSRAHLLKLLDGITEEQWLATPAEGRWSMQRAATHIVNAELMWMSKKSGQEPQYLGRDTSLDGFLLKQDKHAVKFRERVKKEASKEGWQWKTPNDGTPSYHWSMVRCLQHTIYHTGMISLLRQQVNAPKLEGANQTWAGMVDSIFESVIS